MYVYLNFKIGLLLLDIAVLDGFYPHKYALMNTFVQKALLYVGLFL